MADGYTTIDPSTLQRLSFAGLGNIAGRNPAELEQALYDRMAADIERQSGTNALGVMENTFARGVGTSGGGPSSITSTALAPVLRARSDALTKARNDAFIASQQAQLAGLAQAAGSAQQALTSGTGANLQQQQLDLAKRNAANQRSLQTQQAVGQGVGGLAGAGLQTAGLIYGPQIRAGLDKLAGVGGGPGGEKMPSLAMTPTGTPSIPEAPSPTAGMPYGDFTPTSYTMPSTSSFSSPALSSLASGVDLSSFPGFGGDFASTSFDLPSASYSLLNSGGYYF